MTPQEENTFRALRDESLLRTRWQCSIGLHKWTKWSKPDTSPGTIWAKQERECVACGEYQYKKTKVN